MTGKRIAGICAGVALGAVVLTHAATTITNSISKTSKKCRRRKESNK